MNYKRALDLFTMLLASLLMAGCATPPALPDTELAIEAQGASWLAFQDGDSEWTVLSLNEASALGVTHKVSRKDLAGQAVDPLAIQTVNVDDEMGRYAVARVCANETGSDLAIYYNTLSASKTVSANCYQETVRRYMLSGQILGFMEGDSAEVRAGSQGVTSDNGTFKLELAAGKYDLISKVVQSGIVTLAQLNDLDIFKDSVVDIDVSSASNLRENTAAVRNLNTNESVESTVTLISKNGTRMPMGASQEQSYSYSYPDLGDFVYELAASSLSFDPATGKGTRRSATQIFTGSEPKTLELPNNTGILSFTESSLPKVKWQGGGTGSYNLFLQQANHQVFVSQTQAYLANQDFEFRLEDFSTLADWRGWGFDESEINWSVYMRTSIGQKGLAGYRSSFIQTFGRF